MKSMLIILFGLTGLAVCQEGLPVAVDSSHFAAIKKQSPFLRTLSFSDTWTLRGVAQIDEMPVAAVYNRETKKTVTVTSTEANELGWKMVEVVPADDLNGVSVKIDFGGEVAELKYDPQQIQPTPSPSKGGDGKDGDRKRRGPTKEEMERWKALSDEQKKKFGEYIKAIRTKYPNASREEIGPMIRGALSRMADGYEIEIPQVPAGAQPPQGRPQGGGDRDRGGDRRR